MRSNRVARHWQERPDSVPLDFIAIVQIDPGSQTTATICPLGDGNDGTRCQQWSGWQ